MNRYLPLLTLAAALLAACSSAPSSTTATAPATPAPAVTQPAPIRGPGLHGQLLGVAAGADVDLALLTLDTRGRPSGLLSQVHLRGDGAPLRFHLPLQAGQYANGQRLELRGRVSLSGRLVQRLPPRAISELRDQDLGALHLVPAP